MFLRDVSTGLLHTDGFMTKSELIEILGHSVGIATSAEDALAHLATASYDMIFTDYHMPGLDGAALRERIAAEHPALSGRTVLVTGDARHRSSAAAGSPARSTPPATGGATTCASRPMAGRPG